jgi:hypothetical protein
MLTMQLGPGQALLTAKIKFQRSLNLQQLESAVDRIKTQILENEPMMKRIFIEPDSLHNLRKEDGQAVPRPFGLRFDSSRGARQ